jgi:hypothetical protein
MSHHAATAPHLAIYNGRVVPMDYVSDPKNQFKLAAMRVRDNATEGYVLTPALEVFHISRASKMARRVLGAERDAVHAQAAASLTPH